jgi:hypothetical protein
MYISIANAYSTQPRHHAVSWNDESDIRTEPGYINIGWNYEQCIFAGIFLAYRMMNDPIFISGSTQPETFTQRYGRGNCGDETILNWVIGDTDVANQYYITIGPYGSTHTDPGGVFYKLTLKNETMNPMFLHMYKTVGGFNTVYQIEVGQVQHVILDNQQP